MLASDISHVGGSSEHLFAHKVPDVFWVEQWIKELVLAALQDSY